MQYPFPYKNISGSTDIITNGNFVIVTTGNLSVTGNATIAGTTTTSILVVSGAATSNKWAGSGNTNGDLFSSQTNTSSGFSATAMYKLINSSGDTFDIAIASRLNTTYAGSAIIKTNKSIYINTSSVGQSITLNTNSLPRVTISDTGVSLSSALPVTSGGTALTTVGTNGQVLSSNGTGLVYTNPSVGSVTSISATVPSFLSVTGIPITSSGSINIGLSGVALPLLNGGTGVISSSGANSVVIRDASQNISVNTLTSTVTTGISPLVVSSTTLVGNLNSNYLNGVGFALPAINSAVELNATAQLVTATITGTGSYVKNTSPTLVTPTIGAAVGTSLNLSGLTASNLVVTDAGKNLATVAVLPIINGGTGLTSVGANGTALTSNGTILTYSTIPIYYGAITFNLSSNQTLTTATNTRVNWTNATPGSSTTTGLSYSAGLFTNTSGVTITVQVMAVLLYDLNSSGLRFSTIGTSSLGDVCFIVGYPGSDYSSATFFNTFQMVVGATFSVNARQTSGSNLALIAGNNGCTVSVLRLI